MTKLSCGKKLMKYVLFFVNFLFFLLGAAALGLGIWAKVDKNKIATLTKIGADGTSFNVAGLFETAAIVLLVGGACILVLGFLGCCGALRQSSSLLCLYAVSLGLIVAIEIAAIVIAAIFKEKVQSDLKDRLKKAVNNLYDGQVNTTEEFSLGLDYAQAYFECCGIDNYTDFDGASKWTRNKTIEKIPRSCCKLNNTDAYLTNPTNVQLFDPLCLSNPSDSNCYWRQPCWDKIKTYLEKRIAIVIGIAAGILVLEIICIIFACCIINAIKDK